MEKCVGMGSGLGGGLRKLASAGVGLALCRGVAAQPAAAAGKPA